MAQSLGDRTDYAKNPEKTEKGELVTAFGCDPMTVDEEFLLQKRLYFQQTGKTQKSDYSDKASKIRFIFVSTIP